MQIKIEAKQRIISATPLTGKPPLGFKPGESLQANTQAWERTRLEFPRDTKIGRQLQKTFGPSASVSRLTDPAWKADLGLRDFKGRAPQLAV